MISKIFKNIFEYISTINHRFPNLFTNPLNLYFHPFQCFLNQNQNLNPEFFYFSILPNTIFLPLLHQVYLNKYCIF